jgi:hypothetical protein
MSTVDKTAEVKEYGEGTANGESCSLGPAARNENEPNTYQIRMKWITKREIKERYNEARRQQAKLYNDDGWESKSNVPTVLMLMRSSYVCLCLCPKLIVSQRISASI